MSTSDSNSTTSSSSSSTDTSSSSSSLSTSSSSSSSSSSIPSHIERVRALRQQALQEEQAITTPSSSSTTSSTSISTSTSDSTSSDSVPLITIKKKRSRGALRSTRVVTEEEDEDVIKDVVAHVDETRFLQKVRHRGKGVTMSALEHGDVVIQDAHPGDKQDEAALGDAFTQEITQQTILEKHKEQFIAEQLARRRAAQGNTTSSTTTKLIRDPHEEKQPIRKWEQDEQTLFQTPAHLQRPATEVEEESGERWLAGIAEVSLPIQSKIKNIERTEEAKQALRAKMAQHRPTAEIVTGNYSANFKLHKKQWDAERRQESDMFFAKQAASIEADILAGKKPPPKDADGNFNMHALRRGGHHDGQGPQASDERVVDRFIKKFKSK